MQRSILSRAAVVLLLDAAALLALAELLPGFALEGAAAALATAALVGVMNALVWPGEEHLGELPLDALEEPDDINRFKTDSEYAEDVEIATNARLAFNQRR